jgi:hypothetical protein
MVRLLAGLIGLMTCSVIYALPVYNTDQPELLKCGILSSSDNLWGIEIGYRGDFVFDRKMKNKRRSDLQPFTRNVSNFQNSINAGQVTLDLWNRIDVYGWCGSSQTDIIVPLNFQSIIPGTPPSGLLNVHGHSHDKFAWGIGARAVLLQCGRTAVGIDGQYTQRRAQIECFSIDDVPIEVGRFVNIDGSLLSPNQFHARYQEWQVSLGVSHRICSLVPYVAVKYSEARHNFSGPTLQVFPIVVGGGVYAASVKFRSRNLVGFVAGVTIVDSERMHVTAEGRFFDENALTIAGDIRF